MLKTLVGLAFGLFLFGLINAVGGDQAKAQNCHSCSPPPSSCNSCTPTPPSCNSCTPTPPCNCEHDHDRDRHDRGNRPTEVNVEVNVTAEANASATSAAEAAASAIARARGTASSIGMGNGAGAGVGFGGGSAGPGFTVGVFSSLPDIVVVTAPPPAAARQTRRVAYQATREKTVKVIIQAFCLDDRSTPHPASQLFPEKDVETDFEGEIYRCVAGTRMQYVVADWNEGLSFDNGKTITCAKDQALYHTKQDRLECRKQAPARDCNERSLLRRFGAGIKILTIITTETYTAYREEVVETSSSSSSSSVASSSGGLGVVTSGY